MHAYKHQNSVIDIGRLIFFSQLCYCLRPLAHLRGENICTSVCVSELDSHITYDEYQVVSYVFTCCACTCMCLNLVPRGNRVLFHPM